jgi:dTMP kinase
LGCFFAFEGLDGSGKTTQARLLFDHLASLPGQVPLLLKEPSNGPFGQIIRDSVLGEGPPIDPSEEMNLFFADRAWDVENNILPAIAAKRLVIIDRYILSNIAYQGARGHRNPESIFKDNSSFPLPELTFLLEIQPLLGLRRIKERSQLDGNFETQKFLEKVKSIYDSFDFPSLIRLQASEPEGVIHHRILSAIKERHPTLVPNLPFSY